MDYNFIYGLIISVVLFLFAWFLAKKIKDDNEKGQKQTKREKENQLLGLARDEELTDEERQRLVNILSKNNNK